MLGAVHGNPRVRRARGRLCAERPVDRPTGAVAGWPGAWAAPCRVGVAPRHPGFDRPRPQSGRGL